MTESVWAATYAHQWLAGERERWAHTVAVAHEAQRLAESIVSIDGDVLVAAAFLHDLGYAPGIASTGFHHLDGARHLQALQKDRLARLVAYHSAGLWEAELRGLSGELREFEEEDSPTAWALTYSDLTVSSDGHLVKLRDRVADVEERYGKDHPVPMSLRLGRPEIIRRLTQVSRLLGEDSSAAVGGSGDEDENKIDARRPFD